MLSTKCFVRGVQCEKESCKGCENEVYRFRGQLFSPPSPPPLPEAEMRHREEVAAQLEIAKAQREIAAAQRGVANQLYWARRYRAAGIG